MNILNIAGGQKSPLDALVTGLKGNLARNQGQYQNTHLVGSLTGGFALESADSGLVTSLSNNATMLRQMIVESFDELKEQGIAVNLVPDGATEQADATLDEAVNPDKQAGLSEAQLQAATIVAMAAGNPSDYARAATNTDNPTGTGLNVVVPVTEGIGGLLDHSKLMMTQESYSEAPLKELLSWSILFNAASARQDAFAEAWYPTVVVTPSEAGIALSVARSMVVNSPLHKLDGKPNDFNRRNLIEAARNPAILEDESTRIYPVVYEDGSVDDFFVDPALVQPRVVVIDGFDVRTAPLKFGEKIGLINISTPDFLRSTGVMDLTDAVGNGSRLDKVYVKIGSDVLAYNTRGLPYSGFVKSQEGSTRKVQLFFETEELVLTGDSLTVSGTAPAVAALLKANDLTARIALSVTGSLDTQTSVLNLQGVYQGLASLLDKDGNPVGISDGVGKQVADALKAGEALCFELFAVRTNENRRQRGLLLDQLEERFIYTIPLTSPISVPSPIGSSRPAQHLEALIAAQRMRCSNDAVTSLINFAGQLNDYMAGVRKKGAVPTIGAAGRLLVQPFYEKIEIDALQVVQSIKDKDRAQDIASLLTNTIKDLGVRMLIQSAYPAALAATLTGSKVPKLIVGTDNLIAQHLMVQGDLRTFGVIFKDPVIVATLNEKMDGRIFVGLTRENQTNIPDVLQFGWHAWIPELVSVVPVSRYGQTSNEAMVQSRYLHINNLPILGEIVVKNLSAALVERLAIKVETVPGDGADFPGGSGTGTGGNGSGTGTGSGSGTGAGTGGTP